MTESLLTVLSGSLVGLILSVIGGGGSIISVPLLLYVVGMPSVHAAIGTSAVAVALGAAGNLVAAARGKLVKWPCALVFTAAGVAGSYLGAQGALLMPAAKILSLFGLLMIGVGVMMFLRRKTAGDDSVRLTLKTASLLVPWLVGSGLAVGLLAGFFGIGGGFLIVPGLMFATGMSITPAIATSLVAITAFGAVTASTYAVAGEVVWRTVFLFVLGGVAGSFGGYRLKPLFETQRSRLQGLFAILVVAVGAFTVARGMP